MSARHYSGVVGTDADCLSILLEMHLPPDGKILDCTHNNGVMWKKLSVHGLTSMDIDPQFGTHVVGDFTKLNQYFPQNSFDVLVFDPPHLPTSAASKNSSKIWETRYGITNTKNVGRDGDSISGMFDGFFHSAKTVLKHGGVILCKIADLVHNHKYQWQHIDLILSAQRCGMTACDLMVKVQPSSGNLQSSKWKNVHHLRRTHTYWVVIRNSKRCEALKGGAA